MRGDERVQDGMFSYVSLEQRVPQDHLLRAVGKLTDAVLASLSDDFDALNREVAQQFFAEVDLRSKKFMSDEHFTVDGALIQAWTSQKSFRVKDSRNDDESSDGTNFRGDKRSNATHQSTTDKDARLYKKCSGKESKLSY